MHFGEKVDSLILLCESAAPAEFCDRSAERFHEAPENQPGRTGSGVDPSKKTSSDLYIPALDSWRDERVAVNNLVTQGLMAYCRRYPHRLTGAISPSILDEATRKPPNSLGTGPRTNRS